MMIHFGGYECYRVWLQVLYVAGLRRIRWMFVNWPLKNAELRGQQQG